MNQKLAKKLRAIARRLAETSASGAEVQDVAYFENQKNRKIMSIPKTNKDTHEIELDENDQPIIEKSFPISAGTITIDPKTVRGFYKQLKKN